MNLSFRKSKIYKKAGYVKRKVGFSLHNYLCYWKEHKAFAGPNEERKFLHMLNYLKPPSDGVCQPFYYFIDESIVYIPEGVSISNISVDYGVAINHSFAEIFPGKKERKALQLLCRRICLAIGDSSNPASITFSELFSRKSDSLFDAFQRILFVNQLLWQTNHFLVGLGRLDLILNDLLEIEKKKPGYSEEKTKGLIRSFLLALHSHFRFKSNSLLGDTGQIIVLGGRNENGTYFENDLTCLFLIIGRELGLPDPKIMLRTSPNMPSSLLDLAVSSIETGIGSPILANDNEIVPQLIKSGHASADSFNYAVSACWEPYIFGKSTDQNNAGNINCVQLAIDVISSFAQKECTFEDLLEALRKEISVKANEVYESVLKEAYCCEPFVSHFLHNTFEHRSLLSTGEVEYNNTGVLLTGFGNLIDSLIIVNKLVFIDKKYSISQLNQNRLSNFSDNVVYQDINNVGGLYGSDNEKTIALVNLILRYFNDSFSSYRNKYNGLFTFGISSPSYMVVGQMTKASFDGRKDFCPTNVHYSGYAGESLLELISSFSKLKLPDHCVNGNVLDFVISQSLVENNHQKFVDLLRVVAAKQYFELQFNVLSSRKLLEAQKNPQLYKNLVVRVWGFSAYFVDLPKTYQDLLIQRAIQSEHSIH